MCKTFGDLFIESKGSPILFEGELVHQIYLHTVQGGGTFLVKRLKHKAECLQGLRIKCESAKLEVNGVKAESLTLWSDTSPEEVDVKVVAKSNAIVKFWNVWKNDKTVHAWTGNSGMKISNLDKVVILTCSDGIEEPDFSDLVIELRF